MNGKKIEEKGTQRANDNWYLPDEDELTLKIETIKRYAKDDYICGYTQAVADQQDTLTQYKEQSNLDLIEINKLKDKCITKGDTIRKLEREKDHYKEALRELVALSEAESKDDIIQYEMDYNTELSYEKTLIKAKQLLNNE